MPADEFNIPFDRKTKQFTPNTFPSQYSNVLTSETLDAHMERINKITQKHEEVIRLLGLSVFFLSMFFSVHAFAIVLQMIFAYIAEDNSDNKKYQQGVFFTLIAQFVGSLLICIQSFIMWRRSLKYREELKMELERISSEEEHVKFELVTGWFSMSILMTRKHSGYGGHNDV